MNCCPDIGIQYLHDIGISIVFRPIWDSWPVWIAGAGKVYPVVGYRLRQGSVIIVPADTDQVEIIEHIGKLA